MGYLYSTKFSNDALNDDDFDDDEEKRKERRIRRYDDKWKLISLHEHECGFISKNERFPR